MIPILKTLRQLFGYCFVAYVLLDTPIGVFFLIQLPLIRYKYCFNTWYIIDVLLCHLLHGTGHQRTISGWTGQHAGQYKRYYYQAVVIDKLLELLGDGKHHCKRAFINEKQKGYVQ